MKKYVPDTNALLHYPHVLDLIDGEIMIPEIILHELDRIKAEKLTGRGYQAREAVRALKRAQAAGKVTLHEGIYGGINNDDVIVAFAYDKQAIVVTGDFLMQFKCKCKGIEVFDVESIDDSDLVFKYSGVRDVFLNLSNSALHNEMLARQYSNLSDNMFGLIENEYLIFWDESKPSFDKYGNVKGYEHIESFRYYNGKLNRLKFTDIKAQFSGGVKPINVKQRMMFDMLQDDSIKVKAAFGSFGVGKDYLMIAHAIEMLNRGKVDKLIWVRNNVEVKDSEKIGYLPGDLEEKLLPFLMPLCDHIGGVDGLRNFIDSGMIEIQHLGFIRGRDIKNSIVYVTECENNTKEHIQLLLGRIGEGSSLWLNGDTRQIDSEKFAVNNGVNALKRLRGQSLYGQVTLDRTERSETAKLADLLDD